MHALASTPDYDAQAEHLQLEDAILARIDVDVGTRPQAGKELYGIPGLRVRTLDPVVTGADGPIDVVTYYAGDDIPVFLLDICFTGEVLRLTASEKLDLADILFGIASDYRAHQTTKIVEFPKSRHD